MRAIFCGTGWFPIVDAIVERLPAGFSVDKWNGDVPLTEAVRGSQVILASNGRIDAPVIAAAPELMLIQQPAAGVDGIDLEAARARGVPVCNAPGANHVSMAETALFLMMALARRYPLARKGFAAGQLGVPLGREMRGKTLGIIGFGRSGQVLAEIAGGLGMRVVSVASQSSRRDWHTLLGESDVISLHCPLNSKTEGMLDADAFAAMKAGVLIINCARGPIIDRRALEDALESGRAGGVGLDTFWHEPWDPNDPLFQRDDVIVLPHVGGSSEQSFVRIADIVAGNIIRVGRGEEPIHRVA